MKRAFSMFDQNKDGTIDVNEIKAIFAAFGLDTTDEQMNKLTKEADVNGENSSNSTPFGYEALAFSHPC